MVRKIGLFAGLLGSLLSVLSSGAMESAGDGNVAQERAAHRGISSIFELCPAGIMSMKGRSWKEGCPVELADLRMLEVPCVSDNPDAFTGPVFCGLMVVHKVIAKRVARVFEKLCEAKFPIHSMSPIERYTPEDGNMSKADDASMADNNSSAFCFRPNVTRPWVVSLHGFGLAIDINPLINPYVKIAVVKDAEGNDILWSENPWPADDNLTELDLAAVYPPDGVVYLDRSKDFTGIIKKGDVCYQAFIEEGFEWGGDWKNAVRDYQHFQFKLPKLEGEFKDGPDSAEYILAALALQEEIDARCEADERAQKEKRNRMSDVD